MGKMEEGFLLIVSGPAGVGKGTICDELIKNDDDILYSVSSTTRKPRPGEIDGEDYNFIAKDKFEAMIKSNEFLEYAHVHTDYYGTPRSLVEKGISEGKVVMLEIDVQGALQVKEKYEEAVTVFILPPSMEELERRIVDRNTETKEEIIKRMSNAYKEIALVDDYDYFIVNDNLELAISDLEAILAAEKSKVERYGKISKRYLNK